MRDKTMIEDPSTKVIWTKASDFMLKVFYAVGENDDYSVGLSIITGSKRASIMLNKKEAEDLSEVLAKFAGKLDEFNSQD